MAGSGEKLCSSPTEADHRCHLMDGVQKKGIYARGHAIGKCIYLRLGL